MSLPARSGSQSPVGDIGGERLVWCISLFGEGDGAAVATCAALPWRCPWFLLLGTRIRFFQVMYL